MLSSERLVRDGSVILRRLRPARSQCGVVEKLSDPGKDVSSVELIRRSRSAGADTAPTVRSALDGRKCGEHTSLALLFSGRESLSLKLLQNPLKSVCCGILY